MAFEQDTQKQDSWCSGAGTWGRWQRSVIAWGLDSNKRPRLPAGVVIGPGRGLPAFSAVAIGCLRNSGYYAHAAQCIRSDRPFPMDHSAQFSDVPRGHFVRVDDGPLVRRIPHGRSEGRVVVCVHVKILRHCLALAGARRRSVRSRRHVVRAR